MVCVSVTVLLHNAVESLFCLATLLCLNMVLCVTNMFLHIPETVAVNTLLHKLCC